MDDKLRALYDCRNHWSWLWITGSEEKLSYDPAVEWPFMCACCLYAGAYLDERLEALDKKRDCKKCPLDGYAWNNLRRSSCACDWEGTIYDEWCCCDDDVKERQYWSSRMVSACNRAIEDILTGVTHV